MARRRKRFEKKIYRLECGITGEVFKTTRDAPSGSDLVSVEAYYQLHPEMDDRPEAVIKGLAPLETSMPEEEQDQTDSGS